MASSNGTPPFRYSLFPAALQALRDFGQLAQQRGFGPDFARDVRALTARLRTDPEVWGNSLFNYHHLQLTHYRGMSAYLFTYYSVNFAAHQVFVQSFVAIPYAALA